MKNFIKNNTVKTLTITEAKQVYTNKTEATPEDLVPSIVAFDKAGTKLLKMKDELKAELYNKQYQQLDLFVDDNNEVYYLDENGEGVKFQATNTNDINIKYKKAIAYARLNSQTVFKDPALASYFHVEISVNSVAFEAALLDGTLPDALKPYATARKVQQLKLFELEEKK